MSRHLDCAKYLMVPARRVTIIFILSDIATFLIQVSILLSSLIIAAGGSLSLSANDLKTNQAGSHIFLAGLALQLASFLTFACIYLIFLYRVRRHAPEIWIKDAGKKWYKDWRTLGGALLISCLGIQVSPHPEKSLLHLSSSWAYRFDQSTVRLSYHKASIHYHSSWLLQFTFPSGLDNSYHHMKRYLGSRRRKLLAA